MVAGGWGGYQNGQIPISVLTPVPDGQYLRPDIAAQFERMFDDYVVQNPGYPRPIVISGYRSGIQQQWQLDHPQGQAIAPVGESTHGWAITGDISDTGRHPITHFSVWLDANAHLYGFKRTIDSESWHYQGGFPATILAGLHATPISIPTPKEVEKLELLNDYAPNGGIYLFAPGGLVHVQGGNDHLAILTALIGGQKAFSLAQLKIITGYMDALRTGAREATVPV